MYKVKALLNNFTFVRKIVCEFRNCFYCLLTFISPKLNTMARYRAVFHKYPDFNNPKTFSEKLLWLKLNRYMNDPLVIQCADKYTVREYVKQCGCAEILVDLLDVYDSADDINWEALPNQFVLKWNFGAGYNIICSDKSKMNKEETLSLLRAWGKKKYWLSHAEMQYKKIPKRIICERYLSCGDSDVIPDYKVYCFHGVPKAILVMHDRATTVKTEFFDCEWKPLQNTSKYKGPARKTDKPICFDKMMDMAKKLSEPFPFVRCDFYVVNGELYFGELTFTPAGGLYASETMIEGKYMAEFIHIS